MSELLAIIAIGLFAAAAVQDIAYRRIANRLVVAIAGVALARLGLGLFTGVDVAPLWDLAAALVVLGAGAAAFHFGVLGGGDAKLLAAGALWTGAGSVGAFLAATALAGGLLALGFLVWVAGSRMRCGDRRRVALPYGVAIAAGGILATAGFI